MTRTSDVDDQADRHCVSDVETLGLAHPRLDGYDVPAVLGEQRRLPAGVPDPGLDRDHPPAVADERRRRLQLHTLVLGDGDEVPGRRALPEPHLTGELQVHRVSVRSCAWALRGPAGASGPGPRSRDAPRPSWSW